VISSSSGGRPGDRGWSAGARGDTALDQEALADLRERYDTAAKQSPGCSPGTWLRDYQEQVFLFAREFAVSWTNNVSERGAKAAKRHQAIAGKPWLRGSPPSTDPIPVTP
jgi:hypothetical protein